METKLLLFSRSLLIISLVCTNKIYANDQENIEINFIEPLAVIGIERNKNKKDPLKDIELDYGAFAFYKDNNIFEYNKPNTQPSGSSGSIAKNQLTLQPDEYLKVEGSDKNIRLFNGALIIKFKEIPVIQDFANANGMIFVSDLSDISRGVFKIRNLFDLEDKISQLQTDSNILAIELDLIDPLLSNN